MPGSAPEAVNSDRPPTLDLDQLLSTLDRHGVEYLLVGGVAAQRYGATRPTKDIDCVVRQNLATVERAAAALRDLGAFPRVGGIGDDEARRLPVQIDGPTLLQRTSTWRTDAGDIDVMVEIPGSDGNRVGYDELVRSALVIDVSGRRVQVAALDDIIASKEWANRPKDREALPELYAVRDRQRGATGSASGTGDNPPGPLSKE